MQPDEINSDKCNIMHRTTDTTHESIHMVTCDNVSKTGLRNPALAK